MQSKPVGAARSRAAGELALLEQLRRRVARQPSTGLRLGMGDDCALLGLRRGEEMAITTDLSIDGRHFRLGWHPAESIGHRTLARGLSDLAAMGARPLAAFLSLGLPGKLTRSAGRRISWFDRFFDGFFALAASAGVALAGGDLSESPLAVADIVLAGVVPRGRALLRSGARPGDRLYVTGTLGGAAAGVTRLGQLARAARSPARLAALLRKNHDLLAPHLYPQPRIAQGLWLQRMRLASAALDISDGLSTDLAHLCAESRVAAEIDSAAVPAHSAASLAEALHGGEDYELLFTAPAAARLPRAIAGVPVTSIGHIVPRRAGRPAITLLTPEGPQPLIPRGWQHFA